MAAKVDWDSIGAKLSKALAAKVEKKVEADLRTIQYELESEMDLAISTSPELTIAESERVSLIPFVHVGTRKTLVRKKDGSVSGRFTLDYDFQGDKTMISLSPRKSVHDLIALFNNGYASNNIDPAHPIRGMWHGREITIGPRSRSGAHFIGKALQNCKNNVHALFPRYNITFTVNPNYSTNV